MFGKLTLEQKKTLQQILIQSGLVNTYQGRVQFLDNAGLQELTAVLPMEADLTIFVGALVRECERLGAPPSLGYRHATTLLTIALLDANAVQGNIEVEQALLPIYQVYKPAITAPPPPPPTNKTIRILFLAANPTNTGKLSLEREYEAVEQTLKAAQEKDPALSIELIRRDNVRNDDISEHLLDVRPHVLHFAGHGDLIRPPADAAPAPSLHTWRGLFMSNWENGSGDIADEVKPSGIVLETESGAGHLLPTDTLVRLFRLKKINEDIYMVLLNACWAQGQARALVHQAAVPFAIGMTQPIHDEAAVRFAQGFYRALFRRAAVGDAVESGRFQMEALATGDVNVPVMETRADYDPTFVLIPDETI